MIWLLNISSQLFDEICKLPILERYILIKKKKEDNLLIYIFIDLVLLKVVFIFYFQKLVFGN